MNSARRFCYAAYLERLVLSAFSSLLHFFMNRMAAQERVIFLDFHAVRRIGLIFFGCIARSGFAFFFRFGAFKRYNNAGRFLCHSRF